MYALSHRWQSGFCAKKKTQWEGDSHGTPPTFICLDRSFAKKKAQWEGDSDMPPPKFICLDY
jgi:hypothetical protein